MKHHQNDFRPFDHLAYWMNWFDKNFKNNLSVDFLPSVKDRAHKEILNKIDKEASRPQS